MKLDRFALGAGATALAAVAWLAFPGASSASEHHSAVPHYRHIIEIMMENTSYGTIIGNPLAPRSMRWRTSTAWPRTTSGSPIRASRTTWPTSAARSSEFRTTTSSTARRHWPPPTRTAPAPPSTTRSIAQSLADQLTAAGNDLEGLLPEPAADASGRPAGRDRPQRQRPLHVQVAQQRHRAVCLEAQPVREFRRHPGRGGQHGARHPVVRRPGQQHPAQLRPRGP